MICGCLVHLHAFVDDGISLLACLLLEAPSSPTSVVVSTQIELGVSSIRRGQCRHQQPHRRHGGAKSTAATATTIRSVYVCFHESTIHRACPTTRCSYIFEAISRLPLAESSQCSIFPSNVILSPVPSIQWIVKRNNDPCRFFLCCHRRLVVSVYVCV